MGDHAETLLEGVKEAIGNKTPIRIVGGGTKAGMLGRDTSNSNHKALDVTSHSGIVNYDATELVMTARAGTPLTEIKKELDKAGQRMTSESPTFGKDATFGGTLACNLSGAGRPWGGSMRDTVLGVRLINGKGEHMRFGGQVMKNVAGYDVSRLQAGALGSLGVITEISIKVLPKHEHETTFVKEMDQAAAITEMNRLAATPKPITAAAWWEGKLYVRLGGTENAVKGTLKSWGVDGEIKNDIWTELNEQHLDFFDGDVPLWRLAVKSNTEPLMHGTDTLIDWCGGVRWYRGDYDMEQMEAEAKKGQGHATLFKGGERSTEVRQSLDPLQRKLQENVKNAFDPHGIFNPGTLYSWM